MTGTPTVGELAVRVEEMDRRIEQRFGLTDKALDAALQAAKEAVDKAERAAEKRFEATNEFRGQLADQAATFLPREVADQQFQEGRRERDELRNLIGALQSRIDSGDARAGGSHDSVTTVRANVALAVSVAVLVASVLIAVL